VAPKDGTPRGQRGRFSGGAAPSPSAQPRKSLDATPSASTLLRGSALLKPTPVRPVKTQVGTDHQITCRDLGSVKTRVVALLDDVTRVRPEPDHNRARFATVAALPRARLFPDMHDAFEPPVGVWVDTEFAILRSGLLHANYVQTYVAGRHPRTTVATHTTQMGQSAYQARFASLFGGLFLRGNAVLPLTSSALMMGDVGTGVSVILWNLLCGTMDEQSPATENVRAAEHIDQEFSSTEPQRWRPLVAHLDLFVTFLFGHMSWAHVRVNASTFGSSRKADIRGGRVYVTGERAPAGEPWRFGVAARGPATDRGDGLSSVDTGEGVRAIVTSVNAHALWVWPRDGNRPRLIAIPPFSILLVLQSVLRAWPSWEQIARVTIALAADTSSHVVQLAMRDALSDLAPAPPLRTGEAKVYGLHFDKDVPHAVSTQPFSGSRSWNPRDVAEEQQLFRDWQMPLQLNDFRSVTPSVRMAKATPPPIDTAGDDGFGDKDDESGSSSASSNGWTSSSTKAGSAADGA